MGKQSHHAARHSCHRPVAARGRRRGEQRQIPFVVNQVKARRHRALSRGGRRDDVDVVGSRVRPREAWPAAREKEASAYLGSSRRWASTRAWAEPMRSVVPVPLLLLLLVALAEVVGSGSSETEMSSGAGGWPRGLGEKSGAAVPSFALSGAGVVLTVHGLNFAPGGVNCEHCNLAYESSLCRFDASGDPFPLNYTDTATVNCLVAPRATTVGFAGLSFSNNGGSDWTELAAGSSEPAIVNFAAEPATHALVGGSPPPAGLPVYLSGRHFAASGGGGSSGPGMADPIPFGCAFDGSPGVSVSLGGVSSTVFRCEVPPRGAASVAVLPVGSSPAESTRGRGGRERRPDVNAVAWAPVPWVVILDVMTGSSSMRPHGARGGAHEAATSGGGMFLLALKNDDGEGPERERAGGRDSTATYNAPHVDVALVRVGCLFGATWVSARSASAGSVACVAPARPPGVVPLGAGARHAEQPYWAPGGGSRQSDTWRVRFVSAMAWVGSRPAGPTVVSSGRGARLDFAGAAAEGGALACRTGADTTGDLMTMTAMDAAVGRHVGGDVDGAGHAAVSRWSAGGFARCVIGVHPAAGHVALSVAPPLAGLHVWGAGQNEPQLLVREAPAVRSVEPRAVAAGAWHVNRHLTVSGSNLAGGAAGGAGSEHGSVDPPGVGWCVGLGGSAEQGARPGALVSREPARFVSSAMVTCPPFASDVAAAWAALSAGAVIDSAWNTAGGWDGGEAAGSSRSAVVLDVEAIRVPADARVVPTSGPTSGGTLVVVHWSHSPSMSPVETSEESGDRSTEGGADIVYRCDFGTVSGLAARMVETSVGDDATGATASRPTCVAPAARASTAAEGETRKQSRGVPVRITWRSGGWHPRDVVGEFAYEPPPLAASTTEAEAYLLLSETDLRGPSPGRETGKTFEAAMAAGEAVAASGGSVIALAVFSLGSRDGEGRTKGAGFLSGAGVFCVFSSFHGEDRSRALSTTPALAVSAVSVACEAPPPPGTAGRPTRAVVGGHVALVSYERHASDASDKTRGVSTLTSWVGRHPVAWYPAAEVEAVRPEWGGEEGGAVVTVSGRGLAGGAPGAWLGTIGPVGCRSLGAEKGGGGVAVEVVSPAGRPRRAPVSVSPSGVELTRSGTCADSSGSRVTREDGGRADCPTPVFIVIRGVRRVAPREATAAAVPAAASAAGGSLVAVVRLSSVHGVRVHGASGALAGGALWFARGGAGESVPVRPTARARPHSAWSTWLVLAPSRGVFGGGGWATLSAHDPDGEHRVDVLVVAAAATRAAAPTWTPRGGGGVIWLTGTDLRYADAASDAASGAALCVVGVGERAAALVPFSSAVAACEAPSLSDEPEAAVPVAATTAGAPVHYARSSAAAAVIHVAVPATATRVAPRTAATEGGTALTVSLSHDPGGVLAASLGCAVGTLGPVKGHVADGDAAVVTCVAPARRPGSDRARVAVVPLAAATAPWADDDNNDDDDDNKASTRSTRRWSMSVAYASTEGLRGMRSHVFAAPGAVPVDAAVFSLHGVAARPGVGEELWSVGVCAVSARETTRAPGHAWHRLGTTAVDEGRASSHTVSCAAPLGVVRPGFTTARVVGPGDAKTSGGEKTRGGGFGFFESNGGGGGAVLLGVEPPEPRALYPAEGYVSGAPVVWISGSNLAGATSGGHGMTWHLRTLCVFGGGAADVSAAPSSALVACEAPGGTTRADPGRAVVAATVSASVLPGRDTSPASSYVSTSSIVSSSSPEASAATFTWIAAAPDARELAPRVVSAAGGTNVVVSGVHLRGPACACWFGAIGPVAASCAGTHSARCAAPALTPGVSSVFRYAASAPSADLWSRGTTELWLDVARGGGAVLSAALPPAAVSGARVGQPLALFGTGLGVTGVGVTPGVPNDGDTRVGGAPLAAAWRAPRCAFFTARHVSPSPATWRNGAVAVECTLANVPGPGFHVVGLVGGSQSGEGDGGLTGAFGFFFLGSTPSGGVGVQIEVREGPRVRSAWPDRSPAAGGGVLWVAGADLAAARGGAPMCVVGQDGPVSAEARAVSSALASCEIPPCARCDLARGGATVAAVSLAVALLAAEIPSSTSDAGPAGVSPSQTASDAPASPTDATLWMSYLAGAAGDYQRTVIRPSRGPVWGGTPVRLLVGGGWLHEVGAHGAGCRFGATAVAARWATAGEVECVTPSRGVAGGRVEAAVTPDWRTHSFASPPGEPRAHFQYVRF